MPPESVIQVLLIGLAGLRRCALILAALTIAGETTLAQRGRVRSTPKIETLARDRIIRSPLSEIPSGSTSTAVEMRAQLRGRSRDLAQQSLEALATAKVSLPGFLLKELLGKQGADLSPAAKAVISFQTELQRFEVAELRVLSASEDRPDPAIAAHVRSMAVEIARSRDTVALVGLNRVLENVWHSLVAQSVRKEEPSPERAFQTAAYIMFIEREPEVKAALEIDQESKRRDAVREVMDARGRRRKWRELVECVVGR